MKTLLLHSCCAPCSIVPLELLKGEQWSVTLYYYNPNISPSTEYLRRLHVLKTFAEQTGTVVIEGSYESELWEREVGTLGGPYPLINGSEEYEHNSMLRKQRCLACYRLRFNHLANVAARQNFDAVSTTLSISPYQFVDEMEAVLDGCAKQHGAQALFKDSRACYSEATKRARDLGMYRQNYCGCHYSLQEAAAEREAQKVARKAAQKTARETVQKAAHKAVQPC